MGRLSRAFATAAGNITERSRAKLDAWANAVTGLGTGLDKRLEHTVRYVHPLSEGVLRELFYGDDFAARCVEARPQHALMLGFEIAQDEDGALRDALSRWRVTETILRARIWGRLFGGAAIVVGVNRGRMDEPLDLDAVREGDLLYLYDKDRYSMSVVSRYADPMAPGFDQPELFEIHRQGSGGSIDAGVRVHESRMILFGGALTADSDKPRLDGWDFSVLQRPHEILRDSNASWGALSLLIQDLSQSVFAVEGLVDMIAEGDAETMQRRMAVVNLARSMARAVVIDAESERFENVGAANVSGVDRVMEKVIQRLAAALEMPVTVLMGMSPSGLNATGESDMRSWFNILEVERRELTPAIQRLVSIVAASEGISLDGEPEIVWPSLWTMSPTEEADYQATIAARDKTWIDAGVVTPEEVAVAHWGSGVFSPELAGSVDTDARATIGEEEIAKLVETAGDPEPEPPPTPPPAPQDEPGGGDEEE